MIAVSRGIYSALWRRLYKKLDYSFNFLRTVDYQKKLGNIYHHFRTNFELEMRWFTVSFSYMYKMHAPTRRYFRVFLHLIFRHQKLSFCKFTTKPRRNLGIIMTLPSVFFPSHQEIPWRRLTTLGVSISIFDKKVGWVRWYFWEWGD